MELCLVRHAIAVGHGSPGYGEDERPLTEAGRAKMEQAAAGLVRLFRADTVVTSPLLRARQTADILLEAYGMSTLRVSDALASGEDELLLADLAEFGGDRLVAVGHEPHMSRTLSYLLAGDQSRVMAEFKKGAAALVSFEGPAGAGAGRLEWLLQPAALRAIGRAF